MRVGKRRLMVVGASRGIGAAVAQHFAQQGHTVFSVSRGQPVAGEWIPADISTPDGINAITQRMGESALDALLFMGGVWEQGAFTKDYDFFKSPDAETRFVIAVNTIAPIEITKQLAPNLAKAHNPRAIFMGSTSGLENTTSVEVANTASKFGLRGATQSLRLALRDEKIGITVINPGNVATAEVLTDIAEQRFQPQIPISLQDVISTLEWILSLSNTVDVSEVNLWQKQ